MIYTLFFAFSTLLSALDINQDAKTIKYNNDEYDGVSAYLIAGSVEGHRFCFIPVFYKTENGIQHKSLSQSGINVEPYLITKNYFLGKMILEFKDKKVLQPYFVVNVEADDVASYSSVAQTIQKWQKNAPGVSSFAQKK